MIFHFRSAAYFKGGFFIISYRMSFLDKFKGKTQFLTKGEVSDILGSASPQQNVKSKSNQKPQHKNLSASFAITLPDKQGTSHKNNKKRK